MAFFAAGKRRNLVRALHRDLRLLLPADPGRERLLEYVRLFDPRARLGAAGRINVDNMREIYLTRSSAIEPDVAAEAGVPAGMTVAFFMQNVQRTANPLNTKQEQFDTSVRLLNGLAVRMGGIAWPEASVLQERLEVRVYIRRESITAEAVYEMVAKYVGRMASYHNAALVSMHVSAWHTEDGQFQAEFWPAGKAVLMLREMPRSLGDWRLHTTELSAVRLELSAPADRADRNTARLLGECALEVAAMSGGVCVDQLGFRVGRPDELVFG